MGERHFKTRFAKADQFEESLLSMISKGQTTIDMRSSYAWSLSSTRIEIREVVTISMQC
jgi:hypothetical protein